MATCGFYLDPQTQWGKLFDVVRIGDVGTVHEIKKQVQKILIVVVLLVTKLCPAVLQPHGL